MVICQGQTIPETRSWPRLRKARCRHPFCRGTRSASHGIMWRPEIDSQAAGALHTCLSIYLSIYLSICPSVYLSIHLSICLFMYLSIYLSIYPFLLTLIFAFRFSFLFVSMCTLIFTSTFKFVVILTFICVCRSLGSKVLVSNGFKSSWPRSV